MADSSTDGSPQDRVRKWLGKWIDEHDLGGITVGEIKAALVQPEEPGDHICGGEKRPWGQIDCLLCGDGSGSRPDEPIEEETAQFAWNEVLDAFRRVWPGDDLIYNESPVELIYRLRDERDATRACPAEEGLREVLEETVLALADCRGALEPYWGNHSGQLADEAIDKARAALARGKP